MYYSSLCIYANRYVGSMDIAEDIVQNFFVAVWEKHFLSISSDRFLPYAYRAIRNSCINHYKSEIARDEFYLSLVDEWQKRLEEEESFLYQKEIRAALLKLPPKCRNVFLLKFVKGLKYKEISDLCDISVNTVKYHMGEAFRLLKDNLKDIGY